MTICGRRPRKLRCVATLAMIIILASIFVSNIYAQAEEKYTSDELQSIQIKTGDTLWEIVEDNCIYNGDIREAISKIEKLNNMISGNIKIGDIIYVPYEL